MFITIDDNVFSKCLKRCEKSKFKKTTLHGKIDIGKMKVIMSNDKFFLVCYTNILVLVLYTHTIGYTNLEYK